MPVNSAVIEVGGLAFSFVFIGCGAIIILDRLLFVVTIEYIFP